MLKYFIPPVEGLTPHTVYKVEYTVEDTSPIRLAILAVGYLDHNKLPSINSSHLLLQDRHTSKHVQYRSVYYIKVLEIINLEAPLRHMSDIQNIFELEYHNLQKDNK